MSIMIYFYFTLLSVLIQFCIMDLLDRKQASDLNITNQDVGMFKGLNDTPQALFYMTGDNNNSKNITPSTPIYSNSSLPINPFQEKNNLAVTTLMYDVLFEDYNNTTTSTESSDTNELYTSTEYANVTEFDVFPSQNKPTQKPKIIKPKMKPSKQCFCDLLYHACDINCCCDEDCTPAEQQLFDKCIEQHQFVQYLDWCYNRNNIKMGSIENLICIAKENLPEKKNTVNYVKGNNIAVANMLFNWHEEDNFQESNFLGKPYVQGQPVWSLYEDSVTMMELPSLHINNYCTGRKILKFLKDESYKCIVKLRDLEMFAIYRSIHESQIISVPKDDWKATILNCSTLYCTSWKIIICDESSCNNYNKSLYDPICTETVCSNIALKVEYVFYCHASNITNATVYLHVTNINLRNNFFLQEISVKFYLTHVNSTEKVAKLSGNPGYITDLPIIASFVEGNFTENFLNKTNEDTTIKYPENINGVCFLSNTTNKIVNFANTVRNKCNYLYMQNALNGTENCKLIQNNIYTLLGINRRPFISPLGNPRDLGDNEWIEVKYDILNNGVLHGDYKGDKSTLVCNNLATRLSYVFMYADVSESKSPTKYRIINTIAHVKSQRMVHIEDNIGVTITVDVSFVDITRPPLYEYAGAPQLNIHLPDDFLFPFIYNKGNPHTGSYLVSISVMVVCFMK